MEGKKSPKRRDSEPGASFRTGAVALAFLILGFQLALFVHKAAVTRIVANRDRPDTVFVVDEALAKRLLGEGGAGKERPGPPGGPSGRLPVAAGNDRNPGKNTMASRNADSDGNASRNANPQRHSPQARSIYERSRRRRVENFRFDPNTVSTEDLQRLGFSEKQALSIDAYRAKGGRFRRKSDFAKSYVVADSVFRRLEPFIDIPLVDINTADSAAFDALPGIGGWFAHRMVEYREQLRGYSCKEQLMEIYHFDREKFDALSDLICCSPAEAYPFWTGTLEDLRTHPHIRRYDTARAIILYRENTPKEQWTPQGLAEAGIITPGQAERLARCRLK